jgi:glucose 1-dehydrogenase
MFKDLENKVVVITGAGSGLGKAFSEEFGKLKAKVVMNYLSEKHLDDVNETIKLIEDAGGQAIKVQGDVSVEDDVNNLVANCC